MLRIEEEGGAERAVLEDLDLGDVARLGIVGDGADRALFRVLDADGHPRRMRQEGAAPAARPEGADRRHGEQAGAERDDRAVRRQVVGGRAGRGGDQQPVAGQLLEPHYPVDLDPELGRLARLAEDRDLIDGERVAARASRSWRPASLYSLSRKPTVPRFMP